MLSLFSRRNYLRDAWSTRHELAVAGWRLHERGPNRLLVDVEPFYSEERLTYTKSGVEEPSRDDRAEVTGVVWKAASESVLRVVHTLILRGLEARRSFLDEIISRADVTWVDVSALFRALQKAACFLTNDEAPEPPVGGLEAYVVFAPWAAAGGFLALFQYHPSAQSHNAGVRRWLDDEVLAVIVHGSRDWLVPFGASTHKWYSGGGGRPFRPLAVFARFPELTARRGDETTNVDVARRLLRSSGDLPPELAKACRCLISSLSGPISKALESHAVGAETLFDVAQRLKDVEGFAKYWAWAEANHSASRAAPSPEKVALRNERAAQQASFVAESEANDDWTGIHANGIKWQAQERVGSNGAHFGTWSTRRKAALARDCGCRQMGLDVELNFPTIVAYPADVKAFVDAAIVRRDERLAAAHGPLPPLPKVCRVESTSNLCRSKEAGVRPDFERFGTGMPRLACVLCCDFGRKQKDDKKKAKERARAQGSGKAPAKQNKAPAKKATVKKKRLSRRIRSRARRTRRRARGARGSVRASRP